MEYLPITEGTAADRSKLEAQKRAAGLQSGDGTTFWHGWIVHPVTLQEALRVTNEDDKEFFTAGELASLLSEAEADAADWFIDF